MLGRSEFIGIPLNQNSNEKNIIESFEEKKVARTLK